MSLLPPCGTAGPQSKLNLLLRVLERLGFLAVATPCVRFFWGYINTPQSRGYLPIFSRILLEKVGGTYLSLCNKNSDLNFLKFLLENEVGVNYLSFLGFY